MTVQTDDVTLRVRLDLTDVDRRARDAGPRVPGEERREPERRTPTGPRERRGVDPVGIGGDLIRGRRPGASRLGKAGTKAAGIVAILAAIDLAGPAAIGFFSETFGDAFDIDAKTENAFAANIQKWWNDTGGLLVAGIAGTLAGSTQAVTDLGALAVAGFEFTSTDAAAVLGKNVDVAIQEFRINQAKRAIGGLRVGAALSDLITESGADLFRPLIESIVGEKIIDALKLFGLIGGQKGQ